MTQAFGVHLRARGAVNDLVMRVHDVENFLIRIHVVVPMLESVAAMVTAQSTPVPYRRQHNPGDSLA